MYELLRILTSLKSEEVGIRNNEGFTISNLCGKLRHTPIIVREKILITHTVTLNLCKLWINNMKIAATSTENVKYINNLDGIPTSTYI